MIPPSKAQRARQEARARRAYGLAPASSEATLAHAKAAVASWPDPAGALVEQIDHVLESVLCRCERLSFRLDGPPKPKARARTYRGESGLVRTRTPAETKAYQAHVRRVATLHVRGHGAWALGGFSLYRYVVRAHYVLDHDAPDGDNLLKATLDALNGVVWVDDRHVLLAVPSKRLARPGERPGTELRIWAIFLGPRRPAGRRSKKKSSGPLTTVLSAFILSLVDGATPPRRKERRPTMTHPALANAAVSPRSPLAAAPAAARRGVAYRFERPAAENPLGLLPDMPARWDAVDLSVEEGLDRLVAAHSRDGSGESEDVPLEDLQNWAVVPVTGGLFGIAPKTGHRAPMPLRHAAFGDLCQALSVGPGVTAFLRDRMGAAIQLGALMTELKKGRERSLVLRVRQGEVTSIVSGRYAPFGAEKMANAVRGALAHHGQLASWRVRGVATGLVDALRLSRPSLAREVKRGDVTEFSLDFRNSDFGDAAFSVRSGLYRLVCANGLRTYEKSGQAAFNHTGNTGRLESATSEAIHRAIAKADGVLDAWARSTSVWLDGLLDQVTEGLTGLGMTEAETKAVSASIERDTGVKALPEARVSLYDFVNGMTDAAKASGTDRRLELEALAGRVLAQGGALRSAG